MNDTGKKYAIEVEPVFLLARNILLHDRDHEAALSVFSYLLVHLLSKRTSYPKELVPHLLEIGALTREEVPDSAFWSDETNAPENIDSVDDDSDGPLIA